RGATPGGDQARSDSALTARTWGLAYLQQHQLPRAEAEFQKVIALAPDQALGYADLGLVYLREGRARDAEAQLQRAAALDSGTSDIGLMLAEVYRITGREGEAHREIDRLLREAAGFFQRALVLARTGRAADAAGAARQFHHALEVTAAYQVSLERLGGAPGPFVGYPVLTFNPNMAVPKDDPRTVAAAIR